ncbi:hypothetical protein CGGC5_v004126 [Colletotrichum fructicola Nara gc5]|uniref:Uncharacterized protein n=1 Tax=Colletotrichum fructicola (strain Nara gc5) TaxID=1213859 RepID=A0A7J6JHY7_COLFN|nr:hypothetical protein CGGC5_v004126 [Colletotrichum fructicola Nara gc5]
MQLIRVIIALGALAAPILAAPIDSKADVKPRWFDLSPSIASFGDEGPVEDADAGAADEAAQAKRRCYHRVNSIKKMDQTSRFNEFEGSSHMMFANVSSLDGVWRVELVDRFR